MTNAQRFQCHGRPKSSDGHEPRSVSLGLTAHCRFCDRSINNVLGVWMLRPGEKDMLPERKDKFVLLDCAGKVTTCDRCGNHCRVAERRNPDSKPFRLSEKPKGVCANCVVTQFLYNTYPVNLQIDEAGPELLLKPGIREAFLSSGLLDDCDLDMREVNWNDVVANWEKPVKTVLTGQNPYRMGDSPKSYRNRSNPKSTTDPIAAKFRDKWGPLLDQNRGVLSGDLGRQFMDESGLRELLDKASGRPN